MAAPRLPMCVLARQGLLSSSSAFLQSASSGSGKGTGSEVLTHCVVPVSRRPVRPAVRRTIVAESTSTHMYMQALAPAPAPILRRAVALPTSCSAAWGLRRARSSGEPAHAPSASPHCAHRSEEVRPRASISSILARGSHVCRAVLREPFVSQSPSGLRETSALQRDSGPPMCPCRCTLGHRFPSLSHQHRPKPCFWTAAEQLPSPGHVQHTLSRGCQGCNAHADRWSLRAWRHARPPQFHQPPSRWPRLRSPPQIEAHAARRCCNFLLDHPPSTLGQSTTAPS